MRRKRDASANDAARRYYLNALGTEMAPEEDLVEMGRRFVAHDFGKYYTISAEMSAGDMDASWQEAEETGAESPGGHVATPDQDNVDEIGRAVGMEFQDNQELCGPEEVLSRRDRRRWELDKRSADGESL